MVRAARCNSTTGHTPGDDDDADDDNDDATVERRSVGFRTPTFYEQFPDHPNH